MKVRPKIFVSLYVSEIFQEDGSKNVIDVHEAKASLAFVSNLVLKAVPSSMRRQILGHMDTIASSWDESGNMLKVAVQYILKQDARLSILAHANNTLNLKLKVMSGTCVQLPLNYLGFLLSIRRMHY